MFFHGSTHNIRSDQFEHKEKPLERLAVICYNDALLEQRRLIPPAIVPVYNVWKLCKTLRLIGAKR